MTLEQIAWRGVHVELPGSDRTVLLHMPQADAPVWLGWYDAKERGWRLVDATLAPAEVAYWAELPKGAD